MSSDVKDILLVRAVTMHGCVNMTEQRLLHSLHGVLHELMFSLFVV